MWSRGLIGIGYAYDSRNFDSIGAHSGLAAPGAALVGNVASARLYLSLPHWYFWGWQVSGVGYRGVTDYRERLNGQAREHKN